MPMKQKIIIYQLFPRLFGNSNISPVFNGSIEQNGCGKFNDITDIVLKELNNLGVTHIWLTGIIRHATLSHYPEYGLSASHPDIVKGKAGSPYAITDYFDIDPDLAVEVPLRMAEFEQLIQRIHNQGLKVIIDFVPNHVARDYHSKELPEGFRNLGEDDDITQSFSASNNFYYFPRESLLIRGLDVQTPDRYAEIPAKATGNDVFHSDPDVNDWYETIKLNYGIDYLNHYNPYNNYNNHNLPPSPSTWIKMTQILLFWASQGIDGFRCDMAGMVPVEFWHYAISQVKSEYSNTIFIAELYEPAKYRDYLENGYFDYLYDKVGMYDSLRSVITGSSTRLITKVWQMLEGMDDLMVRFLENHDEQRIASPFFAGNPLKAIPAMVVAALMNQGPVLVYNGQEVGEPAAGAAGFSGDDGRTSIFDYSAMPELQKWFNNGKCDGANLLEEQQLLRKSYSEILNLAKQNPLFSNGCLYDLMWVNEENPNRDRIFAFLRYGGASQEEALIVVVAFDENIKETTIRIPEHALNTIGFGSKQKFTVQQLLPGEASTVTLLFSQVVTIGIRIMLPKNGYNILQIT